jgi:hypothetical protein
MCAVLLPPGVNPIAVNKYIITYHIILYHIIYHIISYIISYHIISYISYHHIIYHIIYHIIISYIISYRLGGTCISHCCKRVSVFMIFCKCSHCLLTVILMPHSVPSSSDYCLRISCSVSEYNTPGPS